MTSTSTLVPRTAALSNVLRWSYVVILHVHAQQGLKQCLVSVCLSVCMYVGKSTENGLAEMLTDFILNERNRHNILETFLYLVQIKVVLSPVFFSYMYYSNQLEYSSSGI